jgi:putative ABC transport system permease protein
LINFVIGILEQGLIYAPLVLGVYITYKILDFPDLSVDGTFPLGAAVCAVLIVNGVDPILACVIATACGAACGMITGLLHVYLKITNLLSGILMMTALYSANLRIMGKANVPLLSQKTIFTGVVPPIVVALIVVVTIKVILDIYMKTYAGLSLRAVGANKQLVSSLGQNTGGITIRGLAIANALAALSGALMCQYQRFADVSMGSGTVVVGIASVILGLTIFAKARIQGSTACLLYTSPSPRDRQKSRMPSSA